MIRLLQPILRERRKIKGKIKNHLFYIKIKRLKFYGFVHLKGPKNYLKRIKFSKKLKMFFIKRLSCYEMLPQRNVQKRIFAGNVINHLFKYYLINRQRARANKGNRNAQRQANNRNVNLEALKLNRRNNQEELKLKQEKLLLVSCFVFNSTKYVNKLICLVVSLEFLCFSY